MTLTFSQFLYRYCNNIIMVYSLGHINRLEKVKHYDSPSFQTTKRSKGFFRVTSEWTTHGELLSLVVFYWRRGLV